MSARITNVSLMTIWVTDIDAARDFYVDKMGFEARDDVSFGDYRWVTIGHPDQPEFSMHLAIPGPPSSDELADAIRRSLAAGQNPGFGISTDDCHGLYADLVAQGVEFLQPPSDRPYGIEALARDNSGNWIVIVEQKPFDLSGFEPAAEPG